MKTNQWIERQRPQYHTTTTKSYSLRDQIVPDQLSERRQKLWHDIHSKNCQILVYIKENQLHTQTNIYK